MTLYLGNDLISGTQTLVGESRNIGQIIPSAIPLTDAGLHLLDGTLVNGNGIYSAFVDYIAGLVSDYPDLFITEADWQTAVTTYGVCGKFVYDSVANTVRLPKITGILEGTTDATALGDLVEAGLPSIAHYHTWDNFYDNGNFDGWGDRSAAANRRCMHRSNNSVGRYYDLLGTGTSGAIGVDAIYGKSTTVQPQTIKVLYYIVIATSVKTDIEVDIDEVATDINRLSLSYVTETYSNGSSWYRVYSDGWCEQGGRFNADNTTSAATYTVNLLKPYIDTNYSIITCSYGTHADAYKNGASPYSFTTSSFIIQTFNNDALQPIVWEAKGYII